MILPKEEIKYILDTRNLLPGDVLLMNTYSERLRKAMNCQYEHAAIYLGDAFIMEANGAYVVMEHIYSYGFREKTDAVALRLKHSSPITIDNIVRNAHRQMGREYVDKMQYRALRDKKNSDEKDTSNRSFCSRLVAQTYAEENIKIAPNPDFCEPDDFLQSDILEPVQDCVMPVTDDLLRVVISRQKSRDDNDTNSPNAEMFAALSKLFSEDIQELTQVYSAALKYPKKNEKAIELIKQSRMFKHMDDVLRDTPWLMNNEEFDKHYADDVVSGLHLIYSKLGHYDNTIILRYRQLHAQTTYAAYLHPNCKLAVFMRDYIGKMVGEAIEVRKQLGHLYEFMSKKRPQDFASFVEKYGEYEEYQYTDKPLDIGFMLHDLMKVCNIDNVN